MFERSEKKDVELTPELAALERQLAGLDVAPLQIDRDRLMFEAGRAAERSSREIATTLRVAGAPRWFWPSAAAMMAAACVVLAAMLVWRGDAALVAQQAAQPQPAASPDVESPAAPALSEFEQPAGRAHPLYRSIRPAGGYLEQRYLALTGAGSEIRLNGGGRAQPADVVPPATARDLLRELLPPNTPPQGRS
jgi:hypothetical protein